MQRFPNNPNRAPKADRRPRDAQPASEAVQHREDDEPEGTADWLGHIDAGRIPVQ